MASSNELDIQLSAKCPARTNPDVARQLQDYVLSVDGTTRNVRTAVALDNLKIEQSADGTFDKVTGMVMVVDEKTPVQLLKPMMGHMCGKVVSVPVPDVKASNAELQSRATSVALAASMQDELRTRRAFDLSTKDAAFGLSLGHGGRFAGVVGEQTTRGQRKNTHIVVDADIAPQANAMVALYAEKSVGELAASEEYRSLDSASERNARGLAAAMCEQLNIENCITMEDDVNDRNPSNPYHHPRPLVAGPSVSVASTSSMFRKDGVVAVFSGAIDTRNAQGDHIVVPLNAHAGVEMMSMDAARKNTSPALMHAIPRGAARVSSVEGQKLSDDAINSMMGRLFYTAKSSVNSVDASKRVVGRAESAHDQTNMKGTTRLAPVVMLVTGH
jgi:hypothetical protein